MRHENRQLPTLERSATRLFLSHSSRDKYFLRLLERAFANSGIEAWTDHAFLKGGQRFASEIEAAISRSDAVVVLASAAAAESEWVRKEVELATSLSKRVIPCRLDRSVVPDFLADLHSLDFSSDIQRGLTDLLELLGLPRPPDGIFGDCPKEIFRRILEIKLTGVDRFETRIPGMELKTPEEKFIRWKDRPLPTSVGVVAPSRDFLRTNYGGWLEELFREYLTENGWSYSPLDSDHYGEVHYRTRTLCRQGNRTVIYAFLAKQDTLSNTGDWATELWIADADHRLFFGQVLDWSRGYISPDALVSDDFVISRQSPPRTVEISGKSHEVSLAFYCDIGPQLMGIVWVEQLLSMFVEYLGSAGYEVQSIGDGPPLFEVHDQNTLRQPKYEMFLFEAHSASGHSFQFLYESECTGSRASGYSKISVLRGSAVQQGVGPDDRSPSAPARRSTP